MADYGPLDRFLHRLALQIGTRAELSFDLDQKASQPDVAAARAGRHVFVSGLARAGTTILMRRLYATGAFCSLTYRNMPFVLAPKLWRQMSGTRAREDKLRARAHDDGILVNADSPEALDEVFWRVFDGARYMRPDVLLPHAPDAELAGKFAAYVGAVLAADPQGRQRYLSKNNNNILRLPVLARTFPNAVILVPVRHPLSHARSLLSQHENFLAQQHDDRFVRQYMGWLGHHEFGGDHRPFQFDENGGGEADQDASALSYWLALWLRVYTWLAETAPEGAVFVPYEDLCEDPAIWSALVARCDLPASDAAGEVAFSRAGSGPETGGADPQLLARAETLYNDLRARARLDLAAE